jgi:predicted amidohydrolase
MAFLIGSLAGYKAPYSNDGRIPYLWNSGDVDTAPSNQVKITASDGAASDLFGRSVAIGSGRIVVGAYQDDDKGSNSGSAYIYDLNGTQLAKITAPDGVASDNFGYSVAVGCNRIIVGAWGDDDYGSASGSAYIHDLNGNYVTMSIKLNASDGAASDRFGWSLAVGSGRIVVGSYLDDDKGASSGSAYIYDLEGVQLAKITASDGAANDNFGYSVAVGCGRIVVGSTGDDDKGSNSGSAYIFDLSGTQLAKITASDGAANDNFGSSVAVGCGRIVVGVPVDDDKGDSSGSAYIYDLDGSQLAKITASDGAATDLFGYSVAVGSGRIVVGAYLDDDKGSASGSAYIYDLDGTYITKITASDGASNDNFGQSVAVGSGKIVVGSPFDDNKGSAYIYTTPYVHTPYDIIGEQSRSRYS